MSQTSTLSPMQEVVEFFASVPSREQIATFRLSETAQQHIRELLARNSAGTLTDEEVRELDKIMGLNDVVTLIRVRAQQVQGAQPAAPSTPPGT